MKLLLSTAIAFQLTSGIIAAELDLPSIFRDHMVLQRDTPVPIWGTADAGAEIQVLFGDQRHVVTAEPSGRWSVTLAPMPASAEPRQLKINQRVFSDVLVGEVWLCSGQSNMRYIVGKRDHFPGVEHGEAEIAKPERANLRLFSDDGDETWQRRGWQRAEGESVARFSATAYFFGEELHRQLEIPIGIIHVSRGGTSVQAWTRREFALRNPFTRHYHELQLKERQAIARYHAAEREFRLARKAGNKQAEAPVPLDQELDIARVMLVGHLYDTLIEPIAPYALRGTVWYQGESNGSRLATAQAYGSMLRDLIEGWRDRWHQPEQPWYIMQLPCWDGPTSTSWPWVRQGQWEVARNLPHVALTTTCDVADATNLHPPQKREAGQRLAILACAKTYGKSIAAEGPVVKSVARLDHRLMVTFDTRRAPLEEKPRPWKDVELAGADGRYYPATAIWEGDTAIVSSDKVPVPESIRYAWLPVFTPSLFSSSGMPAPPFEMFVSR